MAMTPKSPADGESAALSVSQALDYMLSAVAPISGSECVPLRAALGRILAADVTSPYDVPAHDNSAMDGYALCADSLAADTETSLVVVGTAFAGRPFSGLVGKGQAVRIMTGAVLPAGADVVVEQELVRVEVGEGGDVVVIPPGQARGKNIRHAGEDLARGVVALRAGKRIGAAELGVIASLGVAEVEVKRRLRVAYFSTGDELASIGQTLVPGQIYDSNRYTLFGLLSRLGVDIIDKGVVPDRPEQLEQTLNEAATQADAIITSGGVSVGEADFVKEILAKSGEVKFWKVNVKPGRPMAFGRVGKAWLFGLPGNPVSVMVSFSQFARPALLKLAGGDVSPLPLEVKVRAACSIRKPHGRREYQRGVLCAVDGQWEVRTTDNQGSGVLRSMTEANCFIVLPEDCASVSPGDIVSVQPFEGLSPGC